MNMTAAMEARTNKPLTACTDQEIYLALLDIVREQSAARVRPVTGRKLYYISAEFLIGKLLSNNLINLGLYDDTRAALAAAGKNLSDIEEVEPEPSLGNGGLGRLAACFLDSLATLNLPGDGVGLRYHFGLFHQSFKDGVQNELPDPWLTAHSWAEKTDTVYPVELAGKTYSARLYKLAVTGYEGRTNTLNLFDLDTIDESIVHDGITFDKTDIDKNLTLFLYPDDSDEAGRRLRVYQQYLMVSAGAQLILAECAARGCDYHDLADYAAIQINDTHPSMVIPELIRLLGEKGIDFDEAVEIVTKTCAYTNHTILAEALEKWPRAYLDAVVPQLMPIIEKLDTLARTRTTDESLAIIDGDDRVHMAHMDIHFTHSTNGVAYLHTEILKNSELHGFYQLYPEKFNNKTNGITFRRWLLECDPALTAEIEKLIGSGFRKDAAELEKLLPYTENVDILQQFSAVKAQNKRALADWLYRTQGITVDPDELWNEENGMLAAGPNIDKSGGIPFKNTIYRKYGKTPREGYMEYYDVDGTQLISQGVAIGLIGNYSLDMPQKSMKLRAKSLYGSKTFAAALFDDRPYMEYKSLVLRNSGNDAMSTRLLDGFQSRLLDAYGTQVIHQAWKPVTVFLNGKYWGHMNLRERVDRFFIAQFEGLSLDQADEMDILEANGSVNFGSNKAYRAMLKKIKAGSPATNPDDLQYILDNVDVDNLFEYMALEMFVGNSDIGNIRYYRLHQEGSKWKWIWYDADYGLYSSKFNSPWSYLKVKGMGEQKIDNTIFLKLLEHPDYKRKFLEKLADVYKTFTTEYMTQVLDGVLKQADTAMYEQKKLHKRLRSE